jgi:hypothetical protein
LEERSVISALSAPAPAAAPPPVAQIDTTPATAPPPTIAQPSLAAAGNQTIVQAAGAAGQGFDNTLKTGSLGAPTPSIARKSLLGQ